MNRHIQNMYDSLRGLNRNPYEALGFVMGTGYILYYCTKIFS